MCASQNAAVFYAAAAQFIAEHPYVNVIRYTTFFSSVYTGVRRIKARKICGLVWLFRIGIAVLILKQFERRSGLCNF